MSVNRFEIERISADVSLDNSLPQVVFRCPPRGVEPKRNGIALPKHKNGRKSLPTQRADRGW